MLLYGSKECTPIGWPSHIFPSPKLALFAKDLDPSDTDDVNTELISFFFFVPVLFWRKQLHVVCLNRLLVSQFAALEVIVQDRFSSASFPVTWVALLFFRQSSVVWACRFYATLAVTCALNLLECVRGETLTNPASVCVSLPPKKNARLSLPCRQVQSRLGGKKSSLPWKQKYDWGSLDVAPPTISLVSHYTP